MRVQHLEIPVAASFRRAFRVLTVSQAYDLYLIVGMAALLPLMVLVPSVLFRLLPGLFLVLWAPGYAITAALFPRQGDIDGVARAALSLGLSLATIPVLALVVDQLGWGIRTGPIVLSLSLWIIIWCGIAALRRATVSPPSAAYHPPQLKGIELRHFGDAVGRRQTLIGAVALVVTPILVLFVTPDVSTHLTEFYIVGSAGQAEEYPRVAVVGEELAVTTGIVNGEREELNYRIEVWVSDPNGSGGRTLAGTLGPITLPAGGRWEDQIRWHMESGGEDQQIEFLLFVGEQGEPYRRLHLWIDVVG